MHCHMDVKHVQKFSESLRTRPVETSSSKSYYNIKVNVTEIVYEEVEIFVVQDKEYSYLWTGL
jgi:hypothetical protein